MKLERSCSAHCFIYITLNNYNALFNYKTLVFYDVFSLVLRVKLDASYFAIHLLLNKLHIFDLISILMELWKPC